MNTSMFSFGLWVAFMVVMVVALILASKRGRDRAKQTEDVASRALPEIGRVAERTHSLRFGSIPMGPSPSPTASKEGREKSVSWYPPTKSRAAKPG